MSTDKRRDKHTRARILVLGGYGNFGKRLCEMLSQKPDLEICIGGRSLLKAEALAKKIIENNPKAVLKPFRIDWQSQDFADKLKESQAQIVIHSAGPFQNQDYTVAKTCIALQIHYIDLADSRDFVVNIKRLDEIAKEKGVIVISGASTVPGVSSVVIENYAKKFAILRQIDFGIASGYKTERGDATIEGILSYVGKPFLRLENGEWKTVYSWQNVHRHYYGDNLGLRWHANLDIPDLALLPEKYPMLKTVVFHAGLELSMLHLIMWQMSWLTRINLVKNWKPLSKMITKMSYWFDRFGTDKAGMYVHMSGSNVNYQPLEINWVLVAEKGDGLYIPVVSALILTEEILKGNMPVGAMPCMALYTFEKLNQAMANWNIYSILEEKEM